MARATKQPATEQPAVKAKKPAAKPAAEQPAATTGVGIKELAARLGRDPKSVRASIRRIRGGPQVGQGGRYRWDSESDPDYVQLLNDLSPKAEAEAS